MPKTLFVLNDPPYGTERSYNGLRLAGALSKRDGEEVKVFLLGDAASCAKKDQKVPQGYYNAEVMLRNVGRHGGEIGVCGTCMDARGIADGELTDTTRRSSLDELTTWVQWADRTLVFWPWRICPVGVRTGGRSSDDEAGRHRHPAAMARGTRARHRPRRRQRR